MIVSIILGVCSGSFSQAIDIGLHNDKVVTSIVVSCISGRYDVEAGNDRVLAFEEGDMVFVTLEDDSLTLYNEQGTLGRFREIRLNYVALNSSFRIRGVHPVLESRSYDDNLVLRANDRFITLVNEVDFDKYLAGVVESEAGPNAEKEFYKAQSILCRTFAARHIDRHRSEGFSLCDGVHCQAYKGKSKYNPEILEAIEETTGEVLVDKNNHLITAAYHSNSGGQTQRAADVWISDEPCLQSVVDPFSLHQPNAKWTDTISFNDWKNYLLRNGMNSVQKIPDEIIFVEQMKRKKHFILDKDSILMTKIREDWGLRSSFFDMFPEGDSIVIWGKGYGHGIGMSQEGAMKMARDQYVYEDILEFYFFDVRLVKMEEVLGIQPSQ